MTARTCIAIVLAWSALAYAHPEVDSGVEQINEADFDGALAAFERALASDQLSTSDLETLLARRAMVHLALGDEAAMRTDLAQLAALAPDYTFGRWAPPALSEAFANARGASPLSLVVEPSLVGERTRIEARVENDPGRLVQSIRIHARAVGGGWTVLSLNDPNVDAPAVDYYAEAVGPGGAIVARVASATEPRHFGEMPLGGSDDSALWWGIGIGAAAAVVLAIVIIIAVAAGSSSGQSFGPPVVVFP